MRISDGTTTATITGALVDMEKLAEQVSPEVKREFEAVARRTIVAAKEDWPHRTGTSYAGLRVTTRLTPTHIETVLSATERYTYMMRWSRFTRDEITQRSKTDKQRRFLERRHGKGAPAVALMEKRPWLVLLDKPVRKSEDGLAERLKGELFRLANGGA